MTVCVAIEYRFFRLPDGSIWTPNLYAHSFWRRYLDVFEQVRCLARVKNVTAVDREAHRVDGDGVSFCAVPHYIGPSQFLRRVWQVRHAVNQAVHPGEAFVLRVPGTIGTLAWRRLMGIGYPYAVEVTGDPHEVFSRGAVRHPLRGFFRWQTTRHLRQQCAHASAASYVTARVLQQRYPSSGESISASSVELGDDAIVAAPRVWPAGSHRGRLIFIGSLEQYYKGPDLLIRAMAELLRRDMKVRLTIAGDGRIRTALELLAAAHGCSDRIHFAGQLTRQDVFKHLDAADVFVLPSRTEGLPRAMIEAMARGLVCIGSDAGGIPELLPRDALVPRGNAMALADKLAEVIIDGDRMHRMSARNLETATGFRAAALQQRRIGFYRRLRAITEAWVRDHTSG